jgi:hypothetical protein
MVKHLILLYIFKIPDKTERNSMQRNIARNASQESNEGLIA